MVPTLFRICAVYLVQCVPSRFMIDPDAALHPKKRFGSVHITEVKPVFRKKTRILTRADGDGGRGLR